VFDAGKVATIHADIKHRVLFPGRNRLSNGGKFIFVDIQIFTP
jgi:hypothetical protein